LVFYADFTDKEQPLMSIPLLRRSLAVTENRRDDIERTL